MLRNRLITLLTFQHGVLFRTKNFNPDYRYTSNFVDTWSVDETILIDITKPQERVSGRFENVIEHFAQKSFVPICAGGGIRSIEDAKRYLNHGADKLSINSLLFENPLLVKELIKKFGKQCVVASIDVKKIESTYKVFKDNGRAQTIYDPLEFSKIVEDLGCGEILLNSIDRDGSLEGYDLEVLELVSKNVSIPVIAAGGAGKWGDFLDGFLRGKVDAVSTSNIYHFTEKSIQSAKVFLKNGGINIRL